MTSPATDPRAARSHEAILAAAFDLLAREGPGAITHQRVAQQAGVGRATVYRHWAAPEDLLRDVLYTAELPFFATPALPLRPWLQAAAVPDSLLAEVIDGVAHWRTPDPARSRPTSAPGQPAGSNQETNAVAQA